MAVRPPGVGECYHCWSWMGCTSLFKTGAQFGGPSGLTGTASCALYSIGSCSYSCPSERMGWGFVIRLSRLHFRSFITESEIHVTKAEDSCPAIVKQYYHWYMSNEQGYPVLGSYVNSCRFCKSHY